MKPMPTLARINKSYRISPETAKAILLAAMTLKLSQGQTLDAIVSAYSRLCEPREPEVQHG